MTTPSISPYGVNNGDPRRRGDVVGVGARFVGTTSNGVEWIAYRAVDFAPMCQAFDDLERWLANLPSRPDARAPLEGGKVASHG